MPEKLPAPRLGLRGECVHDLLVMTSNEIEVLERNEKAAYLCLRCGKTWEAEAMPRTESESETYPIYGVTGYYCLDPLIRKRKESLKTRVRKWLRRLYRRQRSEREQFLSYIEALKKEAEA